MPQATGPAVIKGVAASRGAAAEEGEEEGATNERHIRTRTYCGIETGRRIMKIRDEVGQSGLCCSLSC